MLIVSSTSLEYVKVEVTRDDGSNPTADTVKMAFMPDGETPSAGDFKTSDWQTIGDRYYIRCLIGPGGQITLTAGFWVVWVKITDNPEIPIKRVNFIEVI
jgi:hypothetical protein